MKFQMTFYGPHTHDLAEMVMDLGTEGFTAVSVGRGSSKMEATQQAVALMRSKTDLPMDAIEAAAQDALPDDAQVIVAPEGFLYVYCVIKIGGQE